MYSDIEQQVINIVDQQLVAYNARDITAFAATYHPDIEIYSMSEGLIYQGKATLIDQYGEKFNQLTYLKATSLKRIVQGRFLVDHELAESSTLVSQAVEQSVRVVAAYEIVDGLIRRVTFMKG